MLDLNELEQLIANAFADVVADYNQFVDEVIESQDEFSDRGFTGQDIVDTGRLRDSKVVEDTDINQVTFSWEPHSPDNGFPYAPAVWAGFRPFGGKTFVPGRHWPERAAVKLGEVGVTQYLVDKLKEQGLEAEVIQNGDENLDD